MAVQARPLDLAIQVSLHYLPPCNRAIWHIWVILLVWITPVPGGGCGWSRGVAILHSREQSLKPPQATRAQDRGQERLRLPRSSLRHANLLRIHNFLYIDIEHMMVQQTTLATLLR